MWSFIVTETHEVSPFNDCNFSTQAVEFKSILKIECCKKKNLFSLSECCKTTHTEKLDVKCPPTIPCPPRGGEQISQKAEWWSKKSDRNYKLCLYCVYARVKSVPKHRNRKKTQLNSCKALAHRNISWPEQRLSLSLPRETQVHRLKPTITSYRLSECHLFAHWSWMADSNIHSGGWCSDVCEPRLLWREKNKKHESLL